eukprot:6046-Prorocentrum_minimum.AAC.1
MQEAWVYSHDGPIICRKRGVGVYSHLLRGRRGELSVEDAHDLALGATVWMLGATVWMLGATAWMLGATVWMLGAHLLRGRHRGPPIEVAHDLRRGCGLYHAAPLGAADAHFVVCQARGAEAGAGDGEHDPLHDVADGPRTSLSWRRSGPQPAWRIRNGDVRGYGVDVRGYGVDVRSYDVDVRGYGVDVRGYGVATRLSPSPGPRTSPSWMVEGYDVDVRGSLTVTTRSNVPAEACAGVVTVMTLFLKEVTVAATLLMVTVTSAATEPKPYPVTSTGTPPPSALVTVATLEEAHTSRIRRGQ